MIKLLFEFIQFLNTLAPLLMALGVLTLSAVLLSKSIKKHAVIYYAVFAVPFAMVAIPFIGRWFGIETFNFNRIPFLGGILRDYIHAGTLGFPLLVIIMYMGALNPKNPYVKKLLGIRKELSILSGFPILTHALIRVTNNFPRALGFFFDSEAGGRAANALGAGISNFGFVLGVVMLALFIPLWVTSFDSVRKRMGSVRWKKLQRWSYVLYAMLFVHAMCIQVGSMLNPRGGRETPPPAATTVEARHALPPQLPAAHDHTARNGRGGERGNRNAAQPAAGNSARTETATPAAANGGHRQSKGFADIQVGSQTKRSIHIASLLLIFGSYLYLRLRKAKLQKQE